MHYRIKSRIIIAAVFVVTLLSAISAIAQTRTTPVTVDPSGNTVQSQQSGTWNVGVTGTPNFSVTNSPTVKIDSTINTVRAPTQSNMIKLWTSNQTSAPSSYVYSPAINCSGYKEIRVAVMATTSGPSGLSVYYRCDINGAWYAVGSATWASPTHSITDAANFTPMPTMCIFTVPVMSDYCDFYVHNSSANTYYLSQYSWVYLVN